MPIWIIDLIILAVLALSVLHGYRRGFVLTLCGLLAVFVAFLGAIFLSTALAQPMSRLIQPTLETSIHRILLEKTDEAAAQPPDQSLFPDLSVPPAPEDTATDWLSQLPLDQVLGAMGESAFFKQFVAPMQEAIHQGAVQAAGSAAAAVASYLALKLAQGVLFLLAFVVTLVLWTMLSHALNLACHLPGLSLLNKGLGGLLGLIKGGLIVFIAVWLLKGTLLSQTLIDASVLLGFFCENTPLSLLAQLIQPKNVTQ